MKKIALLLTLAMLTATLAACGDDPVTTTAKPGDSGSAPAQTTQPPTQQTTAPKEENTEPSTPGDSTPSAPESDGDDESDLDIIELPNGKVGDKTLEGYDASLIGAWDSEGEMTSDGNNCMFVVTNDRMSAGKLTATFTSLEGSDANDNGIIFGMEENLSEDGSWFWEDPLSTPRYYFLFVSDAGTLYLAKVACGTPWTVLKNTDPIIGYAHGGTITISVEFDGQGNIKCYANDELMIEYQDTNGPTGDRYGIRCEVPGVVYHEVIAEHAE